MPDDLTLPDPARFGLARFADLLPARDHIIGEDLGSFDEFHEAMMQSLAPLTPYEAVIAENIIAIEWELIQHRRMRDAGLREILRTLIQEAVVARENATFHIALDEEWDEHFENGGTEDDWEQPISFDKEAAEAMGQDLAAQAVSQDPSEFAAANDDIAAMGLDVVELMGEAYRTMDESVRHHDYKGQELERRRREVRRDFEALQKSRSVEARPVEARAVPGRKRKTRSGEASPDAEVLEG